MSALTNNPPLSVISEVTVKNGFEPHVISMHCQTAKRGTSYPWHNHSFDELTLVTESTSQIGYAGGKTMAQVNSLFLYRAGERHGAWNTTHQAPCYWVVQFSMNTCKLPMLARLTEDDPARRVWCLTEDQARTFKWFFLEIAREQARQHNYSDLAQSTWMRLLLLSIERWATGEEALFSGRETLSPELRRLWQLVHSAARGSAESLQQIFLQSNYDSMRHSFKRAFGYSPREMLLRLKMQDAKRLLSETGLSIKEIAFRCGYNRQHEFARIFHQRVGLSPSQWRYDALSTDYVEPD